jgi:hypothetical protein
MASRNERLGRFSKIYLLENLKSKKHFGGLDLNYGIILKIL